MSKKLRPVLIGALGAASVAALVITTPALSSAAPAPLAAQSASVQATGDLSVAAKKEIAMKLVSSAENSSLDWKAQYKYIEDIGDGRGYTAYIIGFCSGTGDMLELVQAYTDAVPNNPLAKYLPALKKVNGTDSHSGLGSAFESAWKSAAATTAFQTAQNNERDRVYFNPAVSQGKTDGLSNLGQFAYYDAIVMHGPGTDHSSFGGIRSAAIKKAKPPATGWRRSDLPQGVLRRPQGRHERGRSPLRHLAHRHRAGDVPQRGQLRPAHPAEVEGLRGLLHHQLTQVRDPRGAARVSGMGRRFLGATLVVAALVAATLLTSTAATPADAVPLSFRGDAGQVVTVVADSASATTAVLTAWQRTGTGWSRAYGPVSAFVGKDGVGQASESTSHTPAACVEADRGLRDPAEQRDPAAVPAGHDVGLVGVRCEVPVLQHALLLRSRHVSVQRGRR